MSNRNEAISSFGVICPKCFNHYKEATEKLMNDPDNDFLIPCHVCRRMLFVNRPFRTMAMSKALYKKRGGE